MPAQRYTPYLMGLLIVAALLAAFFGPVLWGGQVYYAGDIARIYHPQRIVLAQALAEGRPPWWSPEVGIGYPMLAVGEIGALYPLNWPLYLALSPERALTLSIVLHYVLAGLGLYWLGRTLGLTRTGALLGGVIYALGGFNIAHLTHISILSVAAWLPWLLGCTHRLLARVDGRRWPWAVALALATTLQFLAGHAQISFMSLMAVGIAGLYLGWRGRHAAGAPRGWALWAGALAAGALLALPQLLPTIQLGALSQRAGGLDDRFFTSFSFHPLMTATFALPYVLGKPHPEGAIELMGYLGLLPLALAWLALQRPRAQGVWLYVALVGLGLFMAFGRWNPLYRVLVHVPILNLFRVPGRYLLWTSLGLAVLAGYGLDRLQAHAAQRTDRVGLGLAGVSLAALAAVAALTLTAAGVDDLVSRWRWIPLALAIAVAALLLASRRLPRITLIALVLLATSVDLHAFGAVLSGTYNQTLSIETVQAKPRSLAFLQAEQGLGRTYTKEEIVPALSVQREALYPNIAMAHGVSSVNMYLPLIPRDYAAYLEEMRAEHAGWPSAEQLNRLNVKHYLIPQLLPVDEASELYNVLNPYAAIPYGQWHRLDAQDVVRVEVESFVSHAAAAPDGQLAAEVVLERCEGQTLRLPLRVGLETAEWAYARSDVLATIRHSLPPIATTFPARSGFPPEDHPGHTYLATWPLATAADFCRLRIEPAMPEAFVRIERIRLVAADGAILLASHLIGLGDMSIIYRSEDVLIYENHDALPRAYALPLSAVHLDAGQARLPQGSLRGLLIPVQVTAYDPHQVILDVAVEGDALLVLADLYYPGWRATVNGRFAQILAVDGVFRGVALPPGAHTVRFEYAWRW